VPAPIVGQIVWAFSDESERAGVMLLAVVTIDPRAVDDARRALRGLLLRGQRRVHTAKESPSRRRAVIDTIARIEDLSAVVICYRRLEGVDRIRGRHLLLQAATGLAVGSGVVSWTLDDQDPAQRARDRASIAQALSGVDHHLRPTYDHRPSHGEPLLWAADAICWVAGAGGDWRRRVAGQVSIREIGP
jgi:hypothetical protein